MPTAAIPGVVVALEPFGDKPVPFGWLMAHYEFEQVITEGTNPQQKDLLHRLVKKVLIHDRSTIEIWYMLPNQVSVRTPAHTAARTCQSANPSLAALPEVWFRIRDVAVTGGDGLPVDEFREQRVEIALGPTGAFETANIGALTRRVTPGRVVKAAARNRTLGKADGICRRHKDMRTSGLSRSHARALMASIQSRCSAPI